MNASRILFVAVVVLAAAIWRLVPHTFNVVPMHALAVWAGACLIDRRRNWSGILACILPVAAQLVSDVILEVTDCRGTATRSGVPYSPLLMAAVYGSLLLSVAIGWLVNTRWTQRTTGPLWVAGAGVASWATFFLLTNFADWAFGNYYPHTMIGLTNCYIAGWLFDSGKIAGMSIAPLSLLGNLAFQGLLFGGWAVLPNEAAEPATDVAGATH